PWRPKGHRARRLLLRQRRGELHHRPDTGHRRRRDAHRIATQADVIGSLPELRAERAHRREPVLAVEQVTEEERDAHVAREERIAAAAGCSPLLLDLADRVHGERAGAIEPYVVARPAVEDKEGVRVARGAVAKADPLGE